MPGNACADQTVVYGFMLSPGIGRAETAPVCLLGQPAAFRFGAIKCAERFRELVFRTPNLAGEIAVNRTATPPEKRIH